MFSKLCFFFLFFLFWLPFTQAGLLINEVMYDSPGSDNNQEFVELYLDSPLNLTGYLLADSSSEDFLELQQQADSLYVLIVEEGFNWAGINASVYSVGATIGNGLNNDYDNLTLKSLSGLILDSFSYSSSLGGNGNGFSLERQEDVWKESALLGGTPGRENCFSANQTVPLFPDPNLVLSAFLSEPVYTNKEYTRFFSLNIEHKENCSSSDNLTVSYNLTHHGQTIFKEFTKKIGCSSSASTGEFVFLEAGNYTLCGAVTRSTLFETNFADNQACTSFLVFDSRSLTCDLQLSLTADKFIYEEGQTVKFQPSLNEDLPFSLEYWIEDLFGRMVKENYTTTNTNFKSWKTKIEEEDRVLFVKAKVFPLCNDTNTSNNYAELMFIVTAEEKTPSLHPLAEHDSVIQINKSPEQAKLGSLLNVEVEVYKGNTSKYSLSAWVEKEGQKISEITKFHLKDKYTEYRLTLPLFLKPDCGAKINQSKALIILEGLNQRTERDLVLSGTNLDYCRNSNSGTISETKTELKAAKLPSGEQNLSFLSSEREEITNGVVYESNAIKAKKIIPYALLVSLGLLGLLLLRD